MGTHVKTIRTKCVLDAEVPPPLPAEGTPFGPESIIVLVKVGPSIYRVRDTWYLVSRRTQCRLSHVHGNGRMTHHLADIAVSKGFIFVHHSLVRRDLWDDVPDMLPSIDALRQQLISRFQPQLLSPDTLSQFNEITFNPRKCPRNLPGRPPRYAGPVSNAPGCHFPANPVRRHCVPMAASPAEPDPQKPPSALSLSFEFLTEHAASGANTAPATGAPEDPPAHGPPGLVGGEEQVGVAVNVLPAGGDVVPPAGGDAVQVGNGGEQGGVAVNVPPAGDDEGDFIEGAPPPEELGHLRLQREVDVRNVLPEGSTRKRTATTLTAPRDYRNGYEYQTDRRHMGAETHADREARLVGLDSEFKRLKKAPPSARPDNFRGGDSLHGV